MQYYIPPMSTTSHVKERMAQNSYMVCFSKGRTRDFFLFGLRNYPHKFLYKGDLMDTRKDTSRFWLGSTEYSARSIKY